MAWTLAYIQGYATPHRLSCKHKHSHKCLQKMLLRRVHHLLFFCTICLGLVSTPICHKKPRRHCKLFKANMHSVDYVTSNPQTLTEHRIFLTSLKPLLYYIKKVTVFHNILKKNPKASKWTRLLIMLTAFFSPLSINSQVSLMVCPGFQGSVSLAWAHSKVQAVNSFMQNLGSPLLWYSYLAARLEARLGW